MPKQQRTKKKTHKLRIVIIAALSLAVVAVTYFLTVQVTQEQEDKALLAEQKVRLDSANKDISTVANQLLSSYSPSEVSQISSKKECGESSAKYGRGTISCRSSYYAAVTSSQTQPDGMESRLVVLVDSMDIFSTKGEPSVRAASESENRSFELVAKYNNSEKTNCYFNIDTYSAEQYSRKYDQNLGKTNVMTLSILCREITKEPIYPLSD